MIEKQLPCNIEAEIGVLGSIILDPEAIAQVADFLKPDDFYRETHRTLYTTILKLYAGRIPPDVITLSDELERIGKLEEVGGSYHLISLVNEVPTSGNVEYYAGIVARLGVCRRLIHVAGQIAAIAYEQAENALQLAEQLLFSIERKTNTSGFASMSDVMYDFINDLTQVHENKVEYIGVPTGFTDLDDTLSGLQKTDLIILAGRPGMGKSAAGMGMVYNAARKGFKCAVFSLEMGKRQLALRLTAMHSGKDIQSIRNGWLDDADWQDIVDTHDALSELPIWINDTSGNPIASMRSQLRRLVSEHGIDLIVVDYLQLIDPPEDKKRRDNRVNEISEITRGLKGIAKEFNVPVLALAQLSRAVESRALKVPQLSDLRESGSIENDADVVLFVYRQDYYEEKDGVLPENRTRPHEADIIIAKHRNGSEGTVTLHFDGSKTQFRNRSKRLEVVR